MKVLLFASPSRKERDISEYTKKTLSLLGYQRDFEDYIVIRSVEDIDSLKDELEKENFFLAIALSGGTSGLISQLSRFNKPVVIVTIPENNSLTSGLKARNILINRGIPTRLYHGLNARNLGIMLKKIDEILKKLKSLRVLLAGVDEEFFRRYDIDVKALKEKLGVEVVICSLDELVLAYERSNPHERVLATFKNKEFDISRASRVRTALENLMDKYNASAVGIRCFPFILRTRITPCTALSTMIDDGIAAGCEADLQALITMQIFLLLGAIPFIGNIVHISDNYIELAHCTIATKLVKSYELMPHFETGNDVAIRGSVKAGEIATFAILSNDFQRLMVFEGIINEKEFSKNVCRTQLRAEVLGKISAEKFFSGHLVMGYGRLKEYLQLLAFILGIQLITL